MSIDVSGKRVLVCGATGNLGNVLCHNLAAEGSRLILCDIVPDKLEKLADDLSRLYGTRPVCMPMDVRDEENILSVLAQLEDMDTIPNAVVNTSYPRNTHYGRHVEEVTLADFSENINWHLGGFFALAKHSCMMFARSGGGSLINVASIYGSMAPRFDIYDGTPMTMPVEYAAIKSSVLHLTRYFAQYYKKRGIRVNSVSPGGIRAGQPNAFLKAYNSHCGNTGMLAAEDVTNVILFLISDASRHMTGQDLIVDDGFSL